MNYGISSQSYLERARKRLNEGTPESLFYAAFELRCGIESRLQQYVEAHQSILKKKKFDWEVPKLAKNLEKVFANLEKIACVTMKEVESGTVIGQYYFTPVTKKLQKAVGRIGELLHCPKTYIGDNNKWWTETRNFLEDIHTDLKIASRGTLLGVPLLNRANKTASFQMEISGQIQEQQLMHVGKRIEVKVDYLDSIPDGN